MLFTLLPAVWKRNSFKQLTHCNYASMFKTKKNTLIKGMVVTLYYETSIELAIKTIKYKSIATREKLNYVKWKEDSETFPWIEFALTSCTQSSSTPSLISSMVWPLCSLTYTWAEDILSTWNLQKKKKTIKKNPDDFWKRQTPHCKQNPIQITNYKLPFPSLPFSITWALQSSNSEHWFLIW